MEKILIQIQFALLVTALRWVGLSSEASGEGPKEAEPATKAANAAMLKALPFGDRQDYEDAAYGFIGTLPEVLIKRDDGMVIWSLKEYGFLKQPEAPPTVNPSLWRQAQLNCQNGLFKVTDGMYQVRGFDISNMTIIEGKTGLIVIDPLISTEVAKAGLGLYYQHRPKRPVAAVIYTHSHVDHWGGVKGVVSEVDVQAGKVQVIAPADFMEAAVAENITAGNAMIRRAQYQFGALLPKGERSQVDAGLGKTTSFGSVTLIPPTDVIKKSLDQRTVDGVDIIFQLASGAEAPAEFHMYYPQFKVLNMAENVSHNFHNLLPFRGAEVRDANAWARYINEALEMFGDQAEVVVMQHHWPIRGNDRVQNLLKKQRDLYKYVHDQSVRLLNHGYPPSEIAETLQLPPSLANEWHARGYYGTVSHNAKAIYQKYLGWYDANPANLNPLPPVEGGKKYIEYMGGAAAVIARARQDFKEGNYRWVAQVMNHVVFADPTNRAARELGADALEQLGYMAESATWRNAYLYGALELRQGLLKIPVRSNIALDVLKALPVDLFFDYLGVRLNGPKANGKEIIINWNFTDVNQQYVLNLENSALTYVPNKQAKNAGATLTLTRQTLDAITLQKLTFPQAMQSGQIKVEGDPRKLGELLSLLDTFNPMFEIVEPKKPNP
ncbi:MAG TPA: alkyl sulfatase dimerization domain-containing protein [Thermodesulfobacteriota bacterium]|nr:alkyl sulfatase dimerization domain-containing protein [Thermodesulfobacteriota bacterium]